MKKLFLIVSLVVCVLLFGCAKDSVISEFSDDDKNAVQNELQKDNENQTENVLTSEDEESSESEQASASVSEESAESEEIENSGESPVIEAAPQEEVAVSAEPSHVSVESITLTTYDVTLNVGDTKMPIVTMSPKNASDKGEIWTSSDESVATVNYLGRIKGVSEGQCTVTVTSTDNPDVSAEVKVTVNKKVNVSTDVTENTECTYIDGILIANKTYPLPQSYAPGWDAEASDALHVMFAAARNDGISLFVKSGYRSYIDQKIIYNGYVARDGKAAADTYSARPGHSEHQTGLAFDINSTADSFAGTPEAKWLAENSYKYGFVVRYPKGKEHTTGYKYEPWHVRYLGVEKSTAVFESGLCLEEYLGITSVYSY